MARADDLRPPISMIFIAVLSIVTNRPLKSLSDMLKGKGGRFRQNLLGKRVDYSGRSVIVIGPELKLNQCGLPKKMALVLFEPFIIRRLKELGYVHTVRSAKKLIERQTPEVWDILEEVTKGHPVLLNRAPTLHRLSIQAFEPILIEGEAIRVHPLVCTAYNADFDGDQMAVHVPLSTEAQMEARMLMLAPNNIFSPSSGKPITTPSQDIPLGCYYLTQKPRGEDAAKDKRLPIFGNPNEVELALTDRAIRTHTRILFKNPDFGLTTVYGDPEPKVLETTAGRVVFNQIWPKALGFYNKVCGKKQLSDIIWRCYKASGQQTTVETLDRLKEMGFREATQAGVSIGINDMMIPKEKTQLLEKAYREVAEVAKQYRRGIITDGERKNKVQDIWTHTGEEIANALFRTLEYNDNKRDMNPVFMMVDSGARGNRTQVKQLAGMRGQMAKPSGEIIEQPITANFREGLTVLEYFISAHGARKGLADTALKTADSGYLTRKLVDAAQDVIITIDDCGTANGIVVRPIYEGDEEVVSLSTRIIGRTSCETVKDPITNKAIIKANQLVDEETAAALDKVGHEQLKIRSALTCESKRGICVHCYGRNLSTGGLIKLGEAVGIIAAQSIGEPGTQLTMRTFHVGGAASQTFKQPIIKAKNDGTVRFNELKVVETVEKTYVVLNKNGTVSLHAKDGRELESHVVVVGSVISVADGSTVKKGETFIQWDPYNVPIITEKAGRIEFRDMIPGVTIRQEIDDSTGVRGTVVIEHKEDLHPQIIIVNEAKNVLASYSIPAGAHIEVKEGAKVPAGQRVARTPRKIGKTKDITGGLPRVAELFEARRPKDAADIAKIDGVVDIGGTVRAKRRLIVIDPETFIQWDPYNVPIITEKAGRIEFRDMIPGVTIRQEIDDSTGVRGTVVIEHKEDLHPQIIIVNEAKNVLASYSIPAGAHIEVKEGAKVPAGQRVARTPRKIGKTKDITGGLPRVAELFEARRPKDAADIAKIDGVVDIGGTVRAKRRLIVIDPETKQEEEHLIPLNKHIIVFKGDLVKKGQQLTEGPVVPHEILEICGPQELQEHLLNEVQEVYRLQGVEINDKHIEIIVRQMLRKVKITEQGDTTLLWGDQVDRLAFEAENEAVIKKGGKPAEANPVLLGITKTALETDSFISAASFQDTTRVLTEAATLGRVDRLRGFKENVIMGHLIPAGTGFHTHRNIAITQSGDGLEATSKEESQKVAS